MIFKIGNTDFSSYVNSLKVDRNTITADTSGRNAAGDMHIDIVTTKYKLTVGFKPLSTSESYALAQAIANYTGITVTFQDPYTNNTTTEINTYTGTPSIEWYRYSNGLKLTKAFSLTFIEL